MRLIRCVHDCNGYHPLLHLLYGTMDEAGEITILVDWAGR